MISDDRKHRIFIKLSLPFLDKYNKITIGVDLD